MRVWNSLAPFALIVLFVSFVRGQNQKAPSEPTAGRVERLGTVNFPTSCAPQLQTAFNRAVALLHSFQYDFAEKAFADVAQKDPQCAMAYWGQAMSLYYQLWAWPDAPTLQQGQSDGSSTLRGHRAGFSSRSAHAVPYFYGAWAVAGIHPIESCVCGRGGKNHQVSGGSGFG